MKGIFFTFLFLILTKSLFAQTSIDKVILEGNKFFLNGEYSKAIALYSEALEEYPYTPLLYYLKAESYYHLNDLTNVILYCDTIIELDYKYVEEAFVLKGEALVSLEKYKDAIELLSTSLIKFPNNYQLNNLISESYFYQTEYEKANDYALKAVRLSLFNPTSHYLLSRINSALTNKEESLIAGFYFLLLEDNTVRTEEIFSLISILLGRKEKISTGASKDAITIVLNPNQGNIGLQLAAQLHNAVDRMNSRNYKETQKKFSDFAKDMQKIIEKAIKKPPKNENFGFWTNFYLPFYKDLIDSGFIEIYCLYVIRNKNDFAKDWLETNKEKADNFKNWLKMDKK